MHVRKRAESGRQEPIGTVRLAASAAGACFAISLAAALGIHYFPSGEDTAPVAAGPPEGGPTYYDSTYYDPTGNTTTRGRSTTATTTSTMRNGPGTQTYRTDAYASTPPGYKRVSGAGVSTVVPGSFTLEVPKSAVATDSADGDFQARFGGGPYGEGSLLAAVNDGAKQVSASTTGYQKVGLAEVAYDGLTAVEWEYRHTTRSGAPARARALYWRERGAEYVLYVTAPEQRWAEATLLFDALVTHCRIGA